MEVLDDEATTPIELVNGAQAAFAPMIEEADRSLAAALYELLSDGEPVEIGRLAEAVHRPEPEVAEDLGAPPFEPLLYRDHAERVVGFGGLGVAALGESRHRLRFDRREVYAWCAEDALFLPIILDRAVQVESRCATTDERISLTVSPSGFADLDPSSTVMSFLDPAEFEARGAVDWGGDVIRNGCHFIHFFVTSGAAQAWISEHPGTVELAIAEGFEFGRRWVAHAFGVRARD